MCCFGVHEKYLLGYNVYGKTKLIIVFVTKQHFLLRININVSSMNFISFFVFNLIDSLTD